MLSKNLILCEKTYMGQAAPPAVFEDCSRYGNNGALTLTAWTHLYTGIWARRFDGADRVNIGDITLLDGKTAFTVLAWVKTIIWDASTRAAIGKYVTAGNQRTFLLAKSDTNKIRFVFSVDGLLDAANDLIGATTLSSTYQLVAGVRNGANMWVYLDGKLDGSTAGANIGGLRDSTSKLSVGSADGDGLQASYWQGWIYGARIFTSALDSGKINEIYASERSLFGV